LIDVINYWNWEDKERAKRRDAGSIQTGTPFGYWVITGAVDLEFRSGLYVWKTLYRPKTFMKSPGFKSVIFSLNGSNNREVRIYPAAQTLFSFQLISRVLEYKWALVIFVEKLRQFPTTFMKTMCSNSDVSNDVLVSQQYQ
jgi:hypothetical protein